jgi:hypothetical protein
LGYAGRYATTRARLAAYLERKLRERGWSGPADRRCGRWSNGWRPWAMSTIAASRPLAPPLWAGAAMAKGG